VGVREHGLLVLVMGMIRENENILFDEKRTSASCYKGLVVL